MIQEKDDSEKVIESNELKIQEMEIKIEALDREINQILNEINLTSEQLTIFLSNRENFTEENWKDIQRLQSELDQKLLCELANVRNPQKVKKTYEERNVGRHWLFVR
jgi:hypothetical protein